MIRLALSAVLLLASTADAQTITGLVRDSSCVVLPGARVVLRGDSTEESTVMDIRGAFAFHNLAEPRYSLHVSLAGFYQFSRKDVLLSDEGSRSFDVRLPLAPLSMSAPPLTIGTPGQSVAGVASAPQTDAGRVHVVADNCTPLGGANVEVRDMSVTRVRTDAAGWAAIAPNTGADAEIRVTKIPIVAMGDSTTAGTPAFESPREAPPNGRGDPTSQYSYWLTKAHPDWNVVNQGINGERSDQIRARFEQDVVSWHPVVVVIIAGVNDVYQGRPVQHVKDELTAMYTRAHEGGIRVVAGTIIPYNVATPEQNLAMHYINEWIRATAKADPGIVFVDTRAAVAATGSPDLLAGSPDGLHPDPAGYHRMADAIAPAIERALRHR
jgi:lysophospholipase L1-like esterase